MTWVSNRIKLYTYEIARNSDVTNFYWCPVTQSLATTAHNVIKKAITQHKTDYKLFKRKYLKKTGVHEDGKVHEQVGEKR